MKKKLILAASLALALGLGVAVGARSTKVNEAKADSVTTMYLDTNKLTWYGDMSRAYLYGDTKNNGWPGAELTQVEGSIYKLDVEGMSDYHSVIFLRSNGTDVWNRTSKDKGTAIHLPEDWSKENMFTFNEAWDGNEYDDGNYTGGWSLYEPVTVKHKVITHVNDERIDVEVADGKLPPEPAVFGKNFEGWFEDHECTPGKEVTAITEDCEIFAKLTNKETITYKIDVSRVADWGENIFVHAWEPNGAENAGHPGAKIEDGTFTLPVDVDNMKFTDNSVCTTNDVTPSGVANDKLIVLAHQTDFKNDVAWESASDIPATDGYYLIGSEIGWTYKTALPMSEGTGDNVAEYHNYAGKEGEKLNIRQFVNTVDEAMDKYGTFVENEYSTGIAEVDGTDLIFLKDENINVFAKWENIGSEFEPNWDLRFYIAKAAETVKVTVIVNGAERGVEDVEKGSLPVAPDAGFGETFTGWFDDAECSKGHEVTSITEATTVYGKVLEVAKKTYTINTDAVDYGEVLNLYAWEGEGEAKKENAPWPGVAVVKKTILIPEDAKFIVNGAEEKQTVDVIQSGVDNDQLIIKSDVDESWHNLVEWKSNTDIPAKDGYYLISSKTDYKYEGAAPMTQEEASITGHVAVLYGYEAVAGEKIKARSYFGGEDKYSENIDGTKDYGHTDEDKNFEIVTPGLYDIYAFYVGESFQFSVVPTAEKVTITLKAALFKGATGEGEVEIASFEFVKGQKYSAPKLGRENYVQLKAYTDEALSVEYVDDTALEADLTLHIKYMKVGYYVTSGAGDWAIENAVPMIVDGVPDTNKAEAFIAVTEIGETYSFVYYNSEGGQEGHAGLDRDDYGFVVNEDSHIKFTAVGSYAIYWSKGNNKIYVNAGLTAFCTNFITQVSGVCDGEHGKTTDKDKLAEIWGTQKNLYNALDAEGKGLFETIGYNGGEEFPTEGTAEEKLVKQVIAKYHYILEKYGTDTEKGGFEDFIFHQKIDPKSNFDTFEVLGSSNNSTVLIIVLSSAAVLSTAMVALLILKKKKLTK